MSAARDKQMLATQWSLIERLKNLEDEKSWREFFNTYWRLIYNFAVRSGLSATEAHDVVQETVLAVCKSMSKQNFEVDPNRGSFKSWLLTQAKWRIVDQYRKRSPKNVHSFDACDESGHFQLLDVVPDPKENPLSQIWDEEWEQNKLTAALDQLQKHLKNSKHYQVFFLLVKKQRSPEAIAKALDIPANQVYLIKHRHMRIFKKILNKVETQTELTEP